MGYDNEEYGSVDLFGLDEFGQAVGPYPAIGAALGVGVQTAAAILVRRFTAQDKWSEGIGAVVGMAAGAGMMAMEKTRAMGWTMVAASGVGGLLRQLETLYMPVEKAKADAGAAAAAIAPASQTTQAAVVESGAASSGGAASGMGMVQVDPAYSLGLPTIEPSASLGSGMGLPPQLVGAGDYGLSQNPAARQAQLVGPGISGLGSHFGSTIFG